MTTVQLFGDIGLYANYKKTIDFSTISEQNAWFNSKQKTTIQNVIYNKPYNSLKLNMQYGQAMQYSYARLLDLDTTGRIYYFFISTVNVIDDATVEFILEPDVIQTYMTYWSLGESMVNRAHVDRWSASSTNPIRITPNNDSINAIYSEESNNIIGDAISHSQTDDVYYAYVIYYDSTTTSIKIIWSPVLDNPNNTVKWHYGQEDAKAFANISNYASNQILESFSIDPESVMTIGVTPYNVNISGSISYNSTDNIFEYITTDTPTEATGPGPVMSAFVDELWNPFHVDTWLRAIQTFDITDVRPVKPTNNSASSDTYEPALFMRPYRMRSIASPNSIFNFDIPDNVLDESESVSVMNLFNPTNSTIACVIGVEQGDMDTEDFMNEARNKGLMFQTMMDTVDVFSDRWLTYALTQQAQDRQILNNQAISNVLQGLIFGSYGGALVTSRGTGGKDRRSLGKMATRMVPGIALGGIASAGSALIDSHFAWENQLLEEQKIQNTAQNINIGGNGGAVNTLYGMSLPRFVVTKCDDTNYTRAYNNFRKYGYLINEFTSLNIKSRKYYNYILTNGACIEGAIPEDARDLISQIFDSGVTIFHGDYCDTLEYPTYENIERSLIQ